MSLILYNTLTRNKETFIPITPNHVTLYVCGITPYDEVHLGHARAYVTFDIVRRHLERSGYTVRYIQNFTDIDDKIIKRANDLHVSPGELAQKNIDDYFIHMDKLGIKRATLYPRVTGSIKEIIIFIEKLVTKGYAYPLNGDVYFSVRKFNDYGKLSRRNLDDLRSGARVEVDEEKKDPLDFALWKKTKPNEPAEASWESPWGKGRPGWHIECSAMSNTALGETIDIHGGGQDLIFPHHENEIAQSEAASGKPFARYWIHNGFVTVNKEKMSKSLGNFFTLRDTFQKYEPRVVRYFLLSQHYRMPLDFSYDNLEQAQHTITALDETITKIIERADKIPTINPDSFLSYYNNFLDALDDDFNTEKALAEMHTLKNHLLANLFSLSPSELSNGYQTLSSMLQDSLGIPLRSSSVPAEITALAKQREDSRKEKNWKEADRLRTMACEKGFKFLDNPDGTTTIIPRPLEKL